MTYDRKAVRHDEWIKIGHDVVKYKIVSEDRWNPYEESPVKNASELCYTLRRIVNEDKRRMEGIFSILKNHPKAIVFYNFDYELELLRNSLIEKDILFSEWNGHKHESIPEGESWVYLVQYSAGAEGWNCISTDTIIFYSQNYSYKATMQASGRIDRLNSPYEDLYYYHLFSDSSIDKSIRRCLDRKKAFNETEFVERSLL